MTIFAKTNEGYGNDYVCGGGGGYEFWVLLILYLFSALSPLHVRCRASLMLLAFWFVLGWIVIC